jgi:hypothetical protein
MQKLFLRYFIFAILFITSNFVFADALRGVKEVGIIIAELDEDARKCNVTKDHLDASVRIPLSNSRVRVVKVATSAMFVTLTVMALSDNSCVANLNLEFVKYIPSEQMEGEFWSKSSIYIYDKRNFQQIIGERLESFTKQFVSAWLKSNSN